MDDLRSAYIGVIVNSVTIIFDEFFGLQQFLPIPEEGENLSISAIEVDSVRIVSDKDSEHEGYLKPIDDLPINALAVLHQIISYEVIKQTSSMIIPKILDEENEIFEFELHGVDFNMTFEEYQKEKKNIVLVNIIDTYDEFNEALMQQRNMLNV